MRRNSSYKRSALERAGFVLFATLIASLIWLVHSRASKLTSPLNGEAVTVTESPIQKQKKDKKHKCPDCGAPGNQEIYVPLIDLPEAQGSEIVFNSRSPQAIDVTPVFYKRNGETVIADPVRIESAEIRYVNIMDLLPERYRHERNWGGFALTYYGFNREIWSQFRFVGVNGGSNVDEFFTVREEARSDNYQAAWWTPEKSEAIVALGNITDVSTSATVMFGSGRARTVDLPPHATELVRDEHSKIAGTESVAITVTGAAGSVIPTGIITSKNGSFNSVIRFYDPSRAKQPNLYANGFRVTGNTPHMVLKNTTFSSIAVVPKFVPLTGEASTPFTLSPVALAPNETTEVDLTPLVRAAKRRPDLNVVSVEVTNPVGPGSIIGSLYAINNNTGTNYDIPLRDSGLVRTMTGSYPWKITDDFRTVVYITNISDQRAEFVGEINYQGGHVLIEPRKLAPGETAVFDLEKFRDEQTTDATGNKLPLQVSLGQFKWSVHGITNGKLLLIGRAEMVSRSQNISSSYSCNDPCPPYYQGDLNPFPPPVVFVSGTGSSSAWESAIYGNGYSYTWAAGADWSADTSAVSIEPSGGHTTTLTGEVPGGACITADMGREESYGYDGRDCYDNNNSYPVGGSGCTDVADVSIYQNGSDITGTTQTVIVGQQISLSVHVAGTTEAVSNIQWNVPGTRVANFTASSSSGTVTQVNNWQASSVTFYWVDGGDNREVHLGCRIGTEQFDKKATFNVKRPTAQISVATNVSTAIDSATGVLLLHLGDPLPLTPGLAFSRTLTLPSGFTSASTEWVQVFTAYDGGWQDINGQNSAFHHLGLDDVYPYDTHSSTNDSPAVTLRSDLYHSQYADFTATMWLMFKPSGVAGTSEWVPLRRVTWHWAAAASFSGGQWVKTSNSDPNGLSDEDTDEYPTWTRRAQDP